MEKELSLEVFLEELDRRKITLSLCDGKITAEPPLSPGLRSTARLLNSKILTHLFRGGDTVSPPQQASDNSSYHPLQTEDPQTMPPDIQAAYDRGESITFSKMRGRWELYKVLEPPKDLSAAALGLMDMYEMGLLTGRVRERIEKLYETNPPDIYERLERAALFVKEKAA